MAGICEECGCVCARCTKAEVKHSDMHLHAEIENLRQRLIERDSHIVTMETQFLNEADKFPNGELASLKEELRIWQEKYSRLYEAHKRVQKVNQNLEDKLLRIVDKCETEKGAFAKDIATLSHRLADANYTIHRLTQDNEKYRNDVNLAIQLLQCKPSNFVGQKYDTLPSEVQAKVRTYVAQKRRSSDASPPDVKSITVPISTFPPTAMVYNITKANVEKHSDDESDDSKPPVDVVSAAIMAKVLEDRERERIFAKHCNTCTCHRTIVMVDSETQTTLDRFDVRVCDDCGSTELRNDINAYDSLNGTSIINSQATDNVDATPVNFRRANETKVSANRGARTENSHLDNSTNVNTKVYGTLNNAEAQSRITRQTTTIQKHNQHLTKQKSSPNERATIAKTNINKIKQLRLSKRIDGITEPRNASSMDHWSKYETDAASPNNYVEPKIAEVNASEKEPSPEEIINDRIWKSGWSNAKSQLNAANDRIENRNRGNSADTHIDVINDRVWKNDSGSSYNINKTQTPMTLIEVTNAVNVTSPKDCGQTESAASPSFSSDSVVISTSNQSSSSSDALHTGNDNAKRLHNNNNGSKTVWKDRTVGPRNCFMRVTPGSKNILLDNVGHYQTVLYTSGSNRPNTALVHVAKSTRSGRSMSTSSEENSPIVTTNDNTQLQRVAEWVQSSVGVAKTTSGALNSREKSSRQQQPLIAAADKQPVEDTLVKIDIDESVEASSALLADNSHLCEVVAHSVSQKTLENPFSDETRNVAEKTVPTNNVSQPELTEDLITFETCNESLKFTNSDNSGDKTEGNYEVKITKEMEEIYLKLAASLDPVSMRLASPGSSSADLTIEKYRKDHRSRIHIQKLQEKPKQ